MNGQRREKNLTAPGESDASGDGRDIVPVSVTSASEEGQGAALAAGAAPRRTTADIEGAEEVVLSIADVIPPPANKELGGADVDISQENRLTKRLHL